MNQYPKSSSHEPTSPLIKPNAVAREDTDGLMSDVIFKLRVSQLCTTLRNTQHLDGESNTMLNVLESLVVAGEIPFSDFMQRVQNLFPDVFDKVDPALRENLLRMLTTD